MPSAHWSDNAGWEISESLNAVLIDDLKTRLTAAELFTVTIDESAANDQTEYLSLELQFIEQGKRVSEFLLLKKITNRTATALTFADALNQVLGISKTDLRTKLVWK